MMADGYNWWELVFRGAVIGVMRGRIHGAGDAIAARSSDACVSVRHQRRDHWSGALAEQRLSVHCGDDHQVPRMDSTGVT